MIANFQTFKVAQNYRNRLIDRGYRLAVLMPYRNGWRVYSGYQVFYS